MILEVAILDVIPNQEEDFEVAFTQASGIISSMGGYASHQLLRCLEKQNRYILLVTWETLEAHTVGFRGSEEYQEWKPCISPRVTLAFRPEAGVGAGGSLLHAKETDLVRRSASGFLGVMLIPFADYSCGRSVRENQLPQPSLNNASTP